MGFDAVYFASDTQLKDELGIKELGVRLSLKAHCEKRIKNEQYTKSNNEKDERKRRLLEEIINPKKRKARSVSKKVSNPKPSNRSVSRSVLMGWIHSGKDKKSKRVGLEKGGGTRTLTATTETTYEDLIKSGKEWFFPKGKSQFGSENEMNFGLADFQRKTLEKEDEDVSFTVGNYAEKNGFKSRIRVYLTSASKLAETINSDDSSEGEDDDLFPRLTSTQISTELWPEQPDRIDNDEYEDEIIEQNTLIGTRDERSALLSEQDHAYLESLRQDEEKDNARKLLLEKELKNVERQEQLRSIRESRLLPEPEISEDHVLVSVRHITEGVVTRAFYATTSMIQLYDWVGSLQLVPEHFKLVSPITGKVWLPEDRVSEASRWILNMIECDEPISLLSDDHAINAAGFSELDETPTDVFVPDASREVPVAEEVEDKWYVKDRLTFCYVVL
jgi:hypothetical protein